MKRISQLIAFTAFMSMTWAQTNGKISGTVTGDDGTHLVGANIIVLGTGSGASAGSDGEFQILNVPAGSYTVLATYIGYSGKEVSSVRVISGLNTEVNLTLTPSAIEGEVIQVTAERT